MEQMALHAQWQKLNGEFMAAHKAWLDVNDPDGYASGEVHKAWERRSRALDAISAWRNRLKTPSRPQ